MPKITRPDEFKTLADLAKLEGLECQDSTTEAEEFEMLYEAGMKPEEFADKKLAKKYVAYLKKNDYVVE